MYLNFLSAEGSEAAQHLVKHAHMIGDKDICRPITNTLRGGIMEIENASWALMKISMRPSLATYLFLLHPIFTKVGPPAR